MTVYSALTSVLTVMFVDTVAETVDVTVIHSYVAEVSRVEANSDDNDYTVTVNLKTRPDGVAVNREFSTETEFARGDIVVVNIADGDIEAMTLAETVEGTVSAVKANDYLRIDGTTYNYNYAYTTDTVLNGYTSDNKGLYDLENNTPANPGAGDEVVLYLDANGCLVAVAEAGEVAEDYILVKGIHQAYGDNSAKIVKYDGTEETIDIDEVDGNDDPDTVTGNYTDKEQLGQGVYKYSRSGNAYDLSSSKADDHEFRTVQMYEVKIENGRSRMVEEDTAHDNDTYYVDSNTVFVDAYNNTSYIGYNNVPTMSDVEGWIVYDEDNTVADIVFITNDVAYELDNDNFFLVTSANGEEEYNEKGNIWNYTGYINGEKTTLTFADEQNLTVGVYKILKTDSDGNVTDIDRIVDKDEILNNYGVNSDAYATYAKGQSLTVANKTNSDKSFDASKGEVAHERFTYLSDESLVVVVNLNDENDDVDTVAIGDLGDINVEDANNPKDAETSAVYILNVDDNDEAAPVAKLILVVNPDPTGDDADGDKNAGNFKYDITVANNGTARVNVTNFQWPANAQNSKATINFELVDEDGNFVDNGKVELTYPKTSGSATITGTGYGRGDSLDIEAIDIDYTPAEIESVSINTQPTKTEYVAGSKFDASGLVVTVEYSNEKSEEIAYNDKTASSFKFDKKTVDEAGDITVTYGGVESADKVAVKLATVEGIEVKTAPDKTEYATGDDTFDATGLVITVTYSNGEEVDVAYGDDTQSDFNFDVTTVDADTDSVKVTYEGKSDLIEVTFTA